MLADMAAPKPKRRWFQYSLRTLLVFVTVCAIPCSWLAVKLRQAERQREAATAIERLGGKVTWDSKASGQPGWLRCVLGDDFFNTVVRVNLYNTHVTDAGLEHLTGFRQLQQLLLTKTSVSDAGVEQIKALRRLQWLGLSSTRVTDEGAHKLQIALPKCRVLH
jgi:hypothetical protein